MVAMSDGSQRMSFPQKKVNSLQGDVYDQMINKDKIIDQRRNMTLGVALPESQLGQPGQQGVDLVGFLNKFLTPQLQSAPEARLTIVPPTMPSDEEFQRTAALSMLPEVTPERKALFENTDFSKRFLQEGKNVQEELMREFLAQANRGESQRGYGPTGTVLPLTANYQSKFGLPTANNAAYSQAASTAGQLGKYII
jgi:hypothetical protein